MPSSRLMSLTDRPLSSSLRAFTIWPSVYLLFFIWLGKFRVFCRILPSPNFRSTYKMASAVGSKSIYITASRWIEKQFGTLIWTMVLRWQKSYMRRRKLSLSWISCNIALTMITPNLTSTWTSSNDLFIIIAFRCFF